MSPKTRHMWCGRALEDHVVGCAKVSTPAGWLWAPGRGRHFSGVAGAKELHKWICNHYIHVLLIKTNRMIYNMLYKILIKAANACLLSETMCLKGGDDDDMLLEVAGGAGRLVEVAGGAGRLVGVAGGTGRLVEVTQMGGHVRTAGDGWGSGDPGIPRTCRPRGRSDQYSPVT